MKLIKCLLFIILVALIGCTSDKVKTIHLTIHNNSKQEIDSIRITSYGVDVTFKHVAAGSKVKKAIAITSEGNDEGAFLCRIFDEGAIQNQTTFGYFPNTAFIKPYYNITISENFEIKENASKPF